MNNDRVFSKCDSEKILNLFENYQIHNESEKQLIESLKHQILKSKPVDAKKIKAEVVTLDSKVILKNIGTGSREEFHLVFPDDSDLKNRKLSIVSAIGSQIIGNKVGAVIKENCGKEKYYMIEDIIYKPEIYGDLKH